MDKEGRYLGSLNYAPVSMLNNNSKFTLIAGRMPDKDNEIIISSLFANQNQFTEADLSENNAFNYLNVYDDYFCGAYIDSLNLFDYFPNGIKVVGIYDAVEISYTPEVLLDDEKFNSIY